MAFEKLEPGKDGDKFPHIMGPGHVDHEIRNAIQMLWMILPKERRTVTEVEREFRRLVDRALRDLQEDATAFGG